MATTESALSAKLQSIVDEVARAIGRYGIAQGSAQGAKAALRVTLEQDVERVLQIYWTPFQANVPGRCIGMHLEVADPRPHWAEAYLSPTERNWVFTFFERPGDGDIQLAYYQDYATYQEAIEGFFHHSGWYVLTATDKGWPDVTYEVAPELAWTEHNQAMSGAAASPAVQESLKKSTILWMRWRRQGQELTMPVWFLYDNKADKIYVLSGEREQTLPGADQMRECEVILRWKGKNARVAELGANVRVIQPGEEWDTVAEKVAEKRLNIPGLPEETARRWRDTCHLLELKLRT